MQVARAEEQDWASVETLLQSGRSAKVLPRSKCVRACRLCDAMQVASARTGKTALHYAARYGNMDLMFRLLAAGATADLEDRTGTTALHEAAEAGKVELVRHLLQHLSLIHI